MTPKLTVAFRGKPIKSVFLNKETFFIGRNADNDLHIDSLAIAPRHTLITTIESNRLVIPSNPSYPVFINGRAIDKSVLNHGDRISLGKHEIYFLKNDVIVTKSLLQSASTETSSTTRKAVLQVLKGKDMGLLIPLHHPINHLGKDSAESAIIARRDEGYFISALVTHNNITINSCNIDEKSVRLTHGDILTIGESVLQFFN
jgi:pSer/pThr/pTyr-binding forkhead associated (FHA) protein